MKSNKKGVTLIELVVVMAIIAIGAVLTIPNMGPWIQSYRLRSATRDIVSTMRVAQMRAVSTNMDYRVQITGGSYVLQRNTMGWMPDGGTQTLPTGVTINSNTFSGNNPLFSPNSSSNGGRLVLENTKKTQRTITVLPSTGRISIQ